MTREEAIEEIKRWTPILLNSGRQCTEKTSEAQDMAISALSALEFDIQEAYCKGKIDGIKECTAKLKKMNEELKNENTRIENKS